MTHYAYSLVKAGRSLQTIDDRLIGKEYGTGVNSGWILSVPM